MDFLGPPSGPIEKGGGIKHPRLFKRVRGGGPPKSIFGLKMAVSGFPLSELWLEVPKRHPPKGHPENLLEFYLNFLNP